MSYSSFRTIPYKTIACRKPTRATQMVSHVHYNSISCVEFELSPMSILGDAAQGISRLVMPMKERSVVNSFAAASKRRVCCIRQDIKFHQRSRCRRFVGRDEAMSMHNALEGVESTFVRCFCVRRAFSRFSQPRGRSY